MQNSATFGAGLNDCSTYKCVYATTRVLAPTTVFSSPCLGVLNVA